MNGISQLHCPYFESIVLDGLYDIAEEDLGGECVAMINYRLRVGAIPAIQLHTAATFGQGSGNRKCMHVGLSLPTSLQNRTGQFKICWRLKGSLDKHRMSAGSKEKEGSS